MDNPITLEEREKYGRNVALVMALKKIAPPISAGPALPNDASTIRKRLQVLSQEITSSQADLLELLVRFDELEGWKCNGSKHCAAWVNSELGHSIQTAWEYLRVGRKLRTLKTLRAFFRVGKISWSKVRIISRKADETNEALLCHAALDASVSDVEKLCEGYRWNDENTIDDEIDKENAQAMQQWLERSLTWKETSNGNTKIQITLPSELAQVFLNSIEQSVNQTDITSTNMSQRRADAAVLMAEKSLQYEGRDIATADHYQVVVSVGADELKKTDSPARASEAAEKIQTAQLSQTTPAPEVPNETLNEIQKRATIQNAGPIAKETTRRIACDCSISVNHTKNGELTNIGRKSRIWPAAMARAIKDRDQVCVWPGCIQSRHLQIHHIKHWADGGETSVSNGACLCSHHHTLVHEGGYTLINNQINKGSDSNADMHATDTQFIQQLKTSDTNQFEFEKNLRHNRESFNSVRKLMPSLYRFRIVDPDGRDVKEIKDIGGSELYVLNDSPRGDCRDGVGKYCVTPVACRDNNEELCV